MNPEDWVDESPERYTEEHEIEGQRERIEIATCEVCGKEMKPAPAKFDGDPAIVGFLPCPDHPHANVKYVDITDYLEYNARQLMSLPKNLRYMVVKWQAEQFNRKNPDYYTEEKTE